MKWTIEERSIVKRLLIDGKSAGEIARVIGNNRSRNCIIGVVHRDKALAAIGFDRGNKARAGERSKPRRATPIRRAKGTAPGQLPGRLFLAAVDGEDRAGEGFYDLKAPAVRVPVPSHQPHFVAMCFIDCLFDRCRAPLSSDLDEKPGPDMLCCGGLVEPGKSYCTYHETRLCDRRHEYRAEAA